jgi:putative transposase
VKYAYIKANRMNYSIDILCKSLEVSCSGYYDWVDRPISAREVANKNLLAEIKGIHVGSKKYL